MQIEETVVVRFVGSTLGVVNPDGIVAESLPHCFPWAHRHEVNGKRGRGAAGPRDSLLSSERTACRKESRQCQPSEKAGAPACCPVPMLPC